MKLTIKPLSDNVTVVTAAVNDQVVEQLVLDTATGTKPVALAQWQADMGGTRPVGPETRGDGRGDRVHA